MSFDKSVSGNGRYDYLIEVSWMNKLSNKYNYAAKLLEVTERSTGLKVTGWTQQERWGEWAEDAAQAVVAEADRELGETSR